MKEKSWSLKVTESTIASQVFYSKPKVQNKQEGGESEAYNLTRGDGHQLASRKVACAITMRSSPSLVQTCAHIVYTYHHEHCC